MKFFQKERPSRAKKRRIWGAEKEGIWSEKKGSRKKKKKSGQNASTGKEKMGCHSLPRKKVIGQARANLKQKKKERPAFELVPRKKKVPKNPPKDNRRARRGSDGRKRKKR